MIRLSCTATAYPLVMTQDSEWRRALRQAFEVRQSAPLPPKPTPPTEAPSTIYCVRCRQELAEGETGHCASCGLPFDRSDETTYALDPSPRWVRTLSVRCAEVSLDTIDTNLVELFIRAARLASRRPETLALGATSAPFLVASPAPVSHVSRCPNGSVPGL